jgi:hypothetical protein
MAAIRVSDGKKRNVPATVAELSGGEYFKFENSRSLVIGLLTISNHVPNRYVLSFQPQSPHPGSIRVFTPLNYASKIIPGCVSSPEVATGQTPMQRQRQSPESLPSTFIFRL